MPGCVVKSCKSRSQIDNKRVGITFHRFPVNNDLWRKDWIDIIRLSRKEENWEPSKTSTVCSLHFESNDLFVTKNGLRKVVTYGVPKNFLSERGPIGFKYMPSPLFNAAPDQHQGKQEVTPLAVADDEYDKHVLCEPDICIKEEVSDESSADENSEKPVMPVNCDNYNFVNVGQPQAQVPPVLYITAVNEEQPIPVISVVTENPRERILQNMLLKSKERNDYQHKKIISLNQLVRRLKHRNTTLKIIVETLSKKFLGKRRRRRQ